MPGWSPGIPFFFGRGQKVKRSSGPAGSEKAIANAADDPEDGSGGRRRLNADPVGEQEEEYRHRNKHETQHQVHDIGVHPGG